MKIMKNKRSPSYFLIKRMKDDFNEKQKVKKQVYITRGGGTL